MLFKFGMIHFDKTHFHFIEECLLLFYTVSRGRTQEKEGILYERISSKARSFLKWNGNAEH